MISTFLVPYTICPKFYVLVIELHPNADLIPMVSQGPGLTGKFNMRIGVNFSVPS